MVCECWNLFFVVATHMIRVIGPGRRQISSLSICLFRINTSTLSSNELGFGAPESGQRLFLASESSFHAAHDFTINGSTFNDVRGNYVRDSSLRTSLCKSSLI